MHSHLNEPGTNEQAAKTVSQSFFPVPQKSSVTQPLPEESGSNPGPHSHLYEPARFVQMEFDGQMAGFSLHSLMSAAPTQEHAYKRCRAVCTVNERLHTLTQQEIPVKRNPEILPYTQTHKKPPYCSAFSLFRS